MFSHDILIAFTARKIVFFVGILAAFFTPSAVLAAENTQRISGEIAFELQDDWNYAAKDRSNQNNNLFATVEPSITFEVAPQWSVFADTSIFSESALRGRDDTRKRDGGVGNTESFESILIALNGEKIPGLGAFGYHVSYYASGRRRGRCDRRALLCRRFLYVAGPRWRGGVRPDC